MTKQGCSFEGEVLDAVLAGSVSPELRAHLDGCAICGEIARVAALVHDDFAHAQRQANLPTADVVWLRAQIRVREEAAQRAARPIMLAQAFTIAALLGLLVALVGRISLGSLAWPALAEIPAQVLMVLGIALVSWLVFAPVVIYLALARD